MANKAKHVENFERIALAAETGRLNTPYLLHFRSRSQADSFRKRYHEWVHRGNKGRAARSVMMSTVPHGTKHMLEMWLLKDIPMTTIDEQLLVLGARETNTPIL